MVEKTNAKRLLDQKKIKYNSHSYPHLGDEAPDGEMVCKLLNQDPKRVFKTLVTKGKNGFFVFLIPVEKTLDLKKAAKECNEKSIEMVHVKDLFSITGYVRGGCSILGMKKMFPTFIDCSALNFETIFFSAGKIGYQIEMNPNDILKVIPVRFEEITLENSNN